MRVVLPVGRRSPLERLLLPRAQASSGASMFVGDLNTLACSESNCSSTSKPSSVVSAEPVGKNVGLSFALTAAVSSRFFGRAGRATLSGLDLGEMTESSLNQ